MTNLKGITTPYTQIVKESASYIKRIVNNCCHTLRDSIGNSRHMIKPSCLVYDVDNDGFKMRTETITDDNTIYKNIETEILPALEKSELEGIPRWFLGGKYKAMTMALVQAKYKYPNRLMIIKSVGGLRTCLIIVYRTDTDCFMAIEPHEHPMNFNLIIKGNII